MDELYEILENNRPEIEFREERALFSGGILDSFDVVNIVSDIIDVFDVTIHADEVNAENFDSAEALWELIQSKMSEG